MHLLFNQELLVSVFLSIVFLFVSPVLSSSQSSLNEQFINAQSFHVEEAYETSIELFEALRRDAERLNDWTMVANCLNYLSSDYSMLEKLEASNEYASKSIALFHHKDIKEDSLLGLPLKIKAENYLAVGQFDSSSFYFSLSAPIFEKEKLWRNFIYTQIGLSVGHYYKHQIDSMEYFLERAYQTTETFAKGDEAILPIIFNLQAVLYNTNGDFDKAINTTEKAIELWESTESREMLETGYRNMGAFYTLKSDLGKAIENFNQALEVLKDSPVDDEYKKANILNSLGQVYTDRGDVLKAEETLKRSFDILQNLPFEKAQNERMRCLTNLAKNEIRRDSFENALFYLHQALPLLGDGTKSEWVNYFIGIAHKELGNYKAAFDTLSLTINKIKLNNERLSYEINSPLRAMGELHASQKDYDKALSYYQEAVGFLSGKGMVNPYFNPEPESINYKRHYLKVLAVKAQALSERYHHVSKDPKDIEFALGTFRVIDHLVDLMRHEYRSEESTHFLLKKVNSIYGQAISAALDLYELTGEEKYKNEAFGFAQKNKAILLLERLEEANSRIFANLPDSLLKMEFEIKRDLAFYQKKIFEEERVSAIDSLKLSVWQNKVFKLKRDLEKFNSMVDEDYPDYASTKRKPHLPSVDEIQNQLLIQGNRYIEYFVGDDVVFIFSISGKGLEVTHFEKPKAFSSLITDLQNTIINPPYGTMNESLASFAVPAHKLYELLLAPVLGHGDQGLVIVPHGILGFIPFEVLLVSPAGANSSSFRGLDYLIKKHPISYSYAAGLLIKNNRVKEGVARCLAFAPTYGKGDKTTSRSSGKIVTRDGETALPGAQKEVQNISKYFPGDYFFGNEATEQAFKKHAPDYRLIHLAMHGFADVSNPMFSKLMFGKEADSTEDQTLFAYEIFNMPLKAELVVLSACETGVGQFVHGEGVKSLAQSFLNTGVSAVTMSLWEAQDMTTSQIMDDYYKHLSMGQTKDQALRLAKLEFLDAGTGFKHPYYWAAFVTIGDVTPLEMDGENWWLYGFGLLFLACIALFMLLKRKS